MFDITLTATCARSVIHGISWSINGWSRNGDWFVGNPNWSISTCLIIECDHHYWSQDRSVRYLTAEVLVKSGGKPWGACSGAAVTQTDNSIRAVCLLLVLMRLDRVVERIHIRLAEKDAAVVTVILLRGMICDFLIHVARICLTMRQCTCLIWHGIEEDC